MLRREYKGHLYSARLTLERAKRTMKHVFSKYRMGIIAIAAASVFILASIHSMWSFEDAEKPLPDPCIERTFPINCGARTLNLSRTLPHTDNLTLYVASKPGKTKYGLWFRDILPYKQVLNYADADLLITWKYSNPASAYYNKLVGYMFEHIWYSNKPASGVVTMHVSQKIGCDSPQIKIPTFYLKNRGHCKAFFDMDLRGTTWMRKTDMGTKGNGISVIRDMDHFREKYGSCENRHNFHVQKMLHPVFLWGKHKFDLRLYVIIARSNPLIIYVDDGYFRVSTFEYDLNNINSLKTNVAVSKRHPDFTAEHARRFPHQFLAYLESLGKADLWDQCIYEIREITRLYFLGKTDFVKKSIEHPNRFEWYGLDFMFDEHLRPYLVESNRWPGHGDEEHFTNFYSNMFELVTRVHSQNLEDLDLEEMGSEYGFSLIYNEIEEYNLQCASQPESLQMEEVIQTHLDEDSAIDRP